MQAFPGFEPGEVESVSALIGPRLGAAESLHDVLAGAAYLAERRATLLGRTPTRSDLEFTLSIWTWWPFKPHPLPQVEEVLLRLRQRAFEGAGSGSYEELDRFVPDETLQMSDSELHSAQQQGIDAFLRPEAGGEARGGAVGRPGSGSGSGGEVQGSGVETREPVLAGYDED